MLRQAVVFLFVEAEGLLLVAFLNARNQLIILLGIAIGAMYGKIILLVPNVLLVGGTKEALTE